MDVNPPPKTKHDALSVLEEVLIVYCGQEATSATELALVRLEPVCAKIMLALKLLEVNQEDIEYVENKLALLEKLSIDERRFVMRMKVCRTLKDVKFKQHLKNMPWHNKERAAERG